MVSQFLRLQSEQRNNNKLTFSYYLCCNYTCNVISSDRPIDLVGNENNHLCICHRHANRRTYVDKEL